MFLRGRGRGFRLKEMEDWNKASMLRHIWNLFARAGSLWVAWVKIYLLKGKSFWKVKILQVCSSSWRKLLKLCVGLQNNSYCLGLVMWRIFFFGLVLSIRMASFMMSMAIESYMMQAAN